MRVDGRLEWWKDSGRLHWKQRVPVLPDDTVDTLAARVFAADLYEGGSVGDAPAPGTYLSLDVTSEADVEGHWV